VKKYLEEQKHFTPRRKAAKDAKKAKQSFIGNLCALASLREIVYFFTASECRAVRGPPRRKVLGPELHGVALQGHFCGVHPFAFDRAAHRQKSAGREGIDHFARSLHTPTLG
jgi:hypothetical protein